MGKTLTKEQRKNSKYAQWDAARKRKNDEFYSTGDTPKKEKPKKKWRPHSEIEAE